MEQTPSPAPSPVRRRDRDTLQVGSDPGASDDREPSWPVPGSGHQHRPAHVLGQPVLARPCLERMWCLGVSPWTRSFVNRSRGDLSVSAGGAAARLVVAALVEQAMHPALVGVEHWPQPLSEAIVKGTRVVAVQSVSNQIRRL